MNTPGYESLARVLHRAYDQAAKGKGAERHACSRPFTEQPMQSISDLLGSETGLLYQAMKKIQESQRLDQDAAIRELLGAINYIAGAIIFKEGKQGELPLQAPCLDGGCSLHATRRIMSEKASEEAIRPLRESTRLDQADSNAPWLCYHGAPGELRSVLVPPGGACPVCFATSN